jgi:drug/metabolite transporter (DMT)-like permease
MAPSFRSFRLFRSFPSFRPPPGLSWMIVAQLLFAGMNVCTRLGARALPWTEVAAGRFIIGALIALGIAPLPRKLPSDHRSAEHLAA